MTLIDLLGEPVCGMTWGWTGVRGTWATPAAAASMTEMASADVTWTAIAYAAEQQTAFSTAIPFDAELTVTDDESAFILHAATIAEAEGCEMFCVGCEMVRVDGQEQQWRALIARVREVYSGLVTYNCDKYQEDRVTWWDAVDIMSSSGYYPIDQWERQLDRIGGVVAAADRPFFFMEAGCPSRTTTTVRMANLPVSTSRVHIDNGRRTPGRSERHRAKEEPRPKSSPGGVLCRTGGSDRI